MNSKVISRLFYTMVFLYGILPQEGEALPFISPQGMQSGLEQACARQTFQVGSGWQYLAKTPVGFHRQAAPSNVSSRPFFPRASGGSFLYSLPTPGVPGAPEDVLQNLQPTSGIVVPATPGSTPKNFTPTPGIPVAPTPGGSLHNLLPTPGIPYPNAPGGLFPPQLKHHGDRIILPPILDNFG